MAAELINMQFKTDKYKLWICNHCYPQYGKLGSGEFIPPWKNDNQFEKISLSDTCLF